MCTHLIKKRTTTTALCGLQRYLLTDSVHRRVSLVERTFEVQYFWVIFPALDTVWVTILPSSGIQGPQIPPCFWEETRTTVREPNASSPSRRCGAAGTHHESQGTGVDVGVVHAAVYFIRAVPVRRAVVMVAEPPRLRRVTAKERGHGYKVSWF